MSKNQGARLKAHRQYVEDQVKGDPEFARAYEQAGAEVDFAVRLAEMREKRRMTQQALADKAGIKQPMLARYERGQIPATPTLQRLARALEAEFVVTASGVLIRPIPRRRL